MPRCLCCFRQSRARPRTPSPLPTPSLVDPLRPAGKLSSTPQADFFTHDKRAAQSSPLPLSSAPPAPEKRRHRERDEKKLDEKKEKDSDVKDNNGLSRGQNFAKVHAWLDEAAACVLVDVSPKSIGSIADDLPADGGGKSAGGGCSVEPPSEHDRLPPMTPSAQSLAL